MGKKRKKEVIRGGEGREEALYSSEPMLNSEKPHKANVFFWSLAEVYEHLVPENASTGALMRSHSCAAHPICKPCRLKTSLLYTLCNHLGLQRQCKALEDYSISAPSLTQKWIMNRSELCCLVLIPAALLMSRKHLPALRAIWLLKAAYELPKTIFLV